jgi:hypothetical protein
MRKSPSLKAQRESPPFSQISGENTELRMKETRGSVG